MIACQYCGLANIIYDILKPQFEEIPKEIKIKQSLTIDFLTVFSHKKILLRE